MAARVTAQEVEVLTQGDPIVRVTAQEVEVLTQGNSIVRVTAQEIEVLILVSSNPNVSDNLNNCAEQLIIGIGLIFSDNANNLSDAANVVIPAGVSQSFSDSLNNFSDSLAYNYLISTIPLTINILDRIDKPAGGSLNTKFPALIDAGVNFVLLPSGPLGINAASLDAYNDDAVTINLGLIFSDNLNNLNDSTVVAYGLTALAFDTLFYNFIDSAAIGFIQRLTIITSDAIVLSDSLVFTNYANPIPPLDDTLTMSDGLNILLRHLLNPTDQLTLTDSLTNLYQYRREFADTIENFNELAATNFGNVATVTVGDSMLNLSDATSRLINTSDTNYLRRYLNDVVN